MVETKLYDRETARPEQSAAYMESARFLGRVGKGLEIGAYTCGLAAVALVKVTGGDEPSPMEWSDVPRFAAYLAPMAVLGLGGMLCNAESDRYAKASKELI